MNHKFTQLVLRWGILALGVTLATRIIPGIHCVDASALIVVVVLLSFFNAILKPVLLLFTLPFILVTLGLGVIVINALLFFLVGKLVNGFEVAGFWSAVGGSLVVSVTNIVMTRFLKNSGRPRVTPVSPARPGTKRGPRKADDVIDI